MQDYDALSDGCKYLTAVDGHYGLRWWLSKVEREDVGADCDSVWRNDHVPTIDHSRRAVQRYRHDPSVDGNLCA